MYNCIVRLILVTHNVCNRMEILQQNLHELEKLQVVYDWVRATCGFILLHAPGWEELKETRQSLKRARITRQGKWMLLINLYVYKEWMPQWHLHFWRYASEKLNIMPSLCCYTTTVMDVVFVMVGSQRSSQWLNHSSYLFSVLSVHIMYGSGYSKRIQNKSFCFLCYHNHTVLSQNTWHVSK